MRWRCDLTIEDLIKMLVDNGVTVGVLVYFMWTQNQTLKDLRDALNKLTASITELMNHEKAQD